MMAAAVIAVTAPGAALATGAIKTFRIPALPIPAAMSQFARQSGVQILFPYDQVKDLKTHAIDGQMSPEVALTQMVRGTGLRVSRTGINVFALSAPASPVRAAARPGPVGLPSLQPDSKPARARSLALAAVPQDTPEPGSAPTPRMTTGPISW